MSSGKIHFLHTFNIPKPDPIDTPPHGERCEEFTARRTWDETGFHARRCTRKAVTHFAGKDMCKQHFQSWTGQLQRG